MPIREMQGTDFIFSLQASFFCYTYWILDTNYKTIWKLQVFKIMCLDHKETPEEDNTKIIQYIGPPSFVI
jgi:hypothetical protein